LCVSYWVIRKGYGEKSAQVTEGKRRNQGAVGDRSLKVGTPGGKGKVIRTRLEMTHRGKKKRTYRKRGIHWGKGESGGESLGRGRG